MRVLVISDGSMFGEGLCALLAEGCEFDVMRIAADAGAQEVLAEVRQRRPDVAVVLDSTGDENGPSLALMRCLKNSWVQTLITVDRRANTFCILSCERRPVDDVQNLLEAITHDLPSL